MTGTSVSTGGRSALLAVAAGLALADASIVTLALPELLHELDTTVEGVAAVLGVYTLVLAAALLPAERLQRSRGAGPVGAIGALVFAAGSLVAGLSDSLALLLVARGVQALGGAALLVAAFAALVGHADPARGRRLWLGAAVLASAAGPALGGALTELFSWEAIFLVQVPVALAAAAACAGMQQIGSDQISRARFAAGPAIALGLVSAALTAVLFLLVLLLVAGWDVAPLKAALAVTVIPAAALVGARSPGDPRGRAAAGCALVGGGVLALGFLPGDALAWTVAPQAAAGLGMGLALPALAGDLLPERNPADAARLLAVRHAGIFAALVLLAPVIAADLDDATHAAKEQGVALVLDARLDPQDKLRLAPALLASVDEQEPRAGLRRTTAEQREGFDGEERVVFARMSARADEVLVAGVGEAFRTAFLVTGALALLAALAVLPRVRPERPLAVGLAALLLAAGYVALHEERAPEPVAIADPCQERALPSTGGITGFLQDRALEILDRSACRYGSSREELVLALADPGEAVRFEEEHGVNPRSAGGIVEAILGG